MPYRVLGLAGSLRQASFNRSLLRSAVSLAPDQLNIEPFELGSVPLFNQDLEPDLPAEAAAFRQALESADALLISTPEYNSQVPGVLKNALDWASRTYKQINVVKSKPVAIMGATDGGVGTSRAQAQLRSLLSIMGLHVLPDQLYVANVTTKMDQAGIITDQETLRRLGKLLESLASFSSLIVGQARGQTQGQDQG
ncbi:MAG: hypothetical protein COU69_00500 [Candidatus Pacebacteria bacterium CG10_big_fil_rev_8_21_14_0_10_56_10]|nr:MAG: hypothetical protein COU69_00500 [Candidatus Pacebacteria bacterium CG10_big_fil_rev_8_21_14_0_10_56_10]